MSSLNFQTILTADDKLTFLFKQIISWYFNLKRLYKLGKQITFQSI